LLVAPVRLHGVDLDHDRLVHRIRDDDPATLLAPAALMLGLRQAGDRAALGGALALRLRVLVALGARQALALRLGCRLGWGGFPLRVWRPPPGPCRTPR